MSEQDRMVTALDEFERYMEAWVNVWFADEAKTVTFVGFVQFLRNGAIESTPVAAGCPPVTARKHVNFAHQETKR